MPNHPAPAEFDPKYQRERHVHLAFYDDNGNRTDRCARCLGDLREEIHFRVGESQ